MALAVTNLVGFGASSGGAFVVTNPIDGVTDDDAVEVFQFYNNPGLITPTNNKKFTIAMWAQYGVSISFGGFSGTIYIYYEAGYIAVRATALGGVTKFDIGTYDLTTLGWTGEEKIFIQMNYDSTASAGNRGKCWIGRLGDTALIDISSAGTDDLALDDVWIDGDGSADFFSEITVQTEEGIIGNVVFVDGTAYANTTFVTTAGGLQPAASWSVTYGSLGFYYPFASSGTLLDDTSGNNFDGATFGGTATHVPDWIS